MKYFWGQGDWKFGGCEGRFGVLKFEMSLRSTEEDGGRRWSDGDVDGNGHG